MPHLQFTIYNLQLKLFFFLLLLATQSVLADANWKVANDHYQKGNFEAALKGYQKIEAQNLEAAALYYNIGNTYFKQNQLAYAILNYEKALKLDPANADILHNIKMANLSVLDKITPIEVIFYKRWWSNFINTFNPSTWALLGIVLFWLAALCVLGFVMIQTALYKRVFFYGGIFVLAFTALFISAAFSYQHQ